MTADLGVWCVVLASRDVLPGFLLPAVEHADHPGLPSLVTRDPLDDTVRRARNLASRARVGAVVSARGPLARKSPILQLPAENLFIQPDYRGTAYEVLLALLRLGGRLPPDTPIVFLPSDHVVSDEEVIMSSLSGMADWLRKDPGKVYLLGAVPEGPHDKLGYIIPWYDAMHMASGVYEFVEQPDTREARKLINAGGLWNTFIFGGTCATLLALYRPRFDAVIGRLRAADENTLRAVYDGLTPSDFSRDVLVPQTHRLSVLRMPRCGWWPLKPPTRRLPLRNQPRAPGFAPDGSDASEIW